MADCVSCPKIYSGKCSDCPEHLAELEEYFGNVDKRIRSVIALVDETGT